MAAGAGPVQSLEHTPTWAVAAVCFVIISLSIVIEQSIHHITKWLKRRRKTGLFDAVDRLKSELMLLGFVSLMLAVTQESIAKICIAKRLANVMLPCRNSSKSLDKFLPVHRGLSEEEDEDRDGDGEESAGKYGGGSEDFCDSKHCFYDLRSTGRHDPNEFARRELNGLWRVTLLKSEISERTSPKVITVGEYSNRITNIERDVRRPIESLKSENK